MIQTYKVTEITIRKTGQKPSQIPKSKVFMYVHTRRKREPIQQNGMRK